jgi:hypothetical protein
MADTAAFIGGIFQFSGQFCPDTLNSKRGKKPEKYRMFRSYTVFFKQGAALFITAPKRFTESCPVSRYGL